MKKLIIYTLLGLMVLLYSLQLFSQSVGIGTSTPAGTAIVDMQSTTKGMLPPRMTSAQRNAIPSPATGLIVFDLNKSLLYMFDGSKWMPLVPTDPEQIPPTSRTGVGSIGYASYFGASVAISDGYAIAGARYDSVDTDSRQGSAYIFARIGGVWVQQVRLFAADGNDHDFFGSSVDISGEYAAIGAPGHGVGGAVYIYKRTGNVWNFETKIATISAGVGFGESVGLSGNMLAVGSPYATALALPNAGILNVYSRTGTVWTQILNTVSPNIQSGAAFGSKISLRDNRLIVGAPMEDISGNSDVGAAYVYNYNGSSWQFEDKLLPTSIEESMNFGESIDISGSIAVVGAPNFAASNQGGFFLFQRELVGINTYEWNSFAIPNTYYNFNINAGWGSSVALSGGNNDYIVVGCYGMDVGMNRSAGICFVYKKTPGQNTWFYERVIVDHPGRPGDSLGYAADMDGTDIVVGVPCIFFASRERPKILLLDMLE